MWSQTLETQHELERIEEDLGNFQVSLLVQLFQPHTFSVRIFSHLAGRTHNLSVAKENDLDDIQRAVRLFVTHSIFHWQVSIQGKFPSYKLTPIHR